MAVKKSGLGKGLGALIPEAAVAEKPATKKEVEKSEENSAGSLIKISKIEPNRDQPRKNFDKEALEALSDSIRQHGVISPITVQKKGDRYIIIAGERRWRAARMAGLTELPAYVGDYSEREIAELSLIENIQREDLNPIEEAQAYRRLMTEFNLKQEEVAERVSKLLTDNRDEFNKHTCPFFVDNLDFRYEKFKKGELTSAPNQDNKQVKEKDTKAKKTKKK